MEDLQKLRRRTAHAESAKLLYRIFGTLAIMLIQKDFDTSTYRDIWDLNYLYEFRSDDAMTDMSRSNESSQYEGHDQNINKLLVNPSFMPTRALDL